MKKDAYFFPHFCNARHDRKLKRVIKELGVEGYGIYFMLLEVLREQTDFRFPLNDIDLLADEFGTSEQKVRTVICNYQLFDVDEDQQFFSMKLVYYLQPYIEKTERARAAAKIRWENVKTKQLETHEGNANAYANAEQMECNGIADAMQGKERRGEESKGENRKEKDMCDVKPSRSRFTPPTLEEVTVYCKERNNDVDPIKWFNFYESKGWMIGKNKMKNWKSAVHTWEKGSGNNVGKKEETRTGVGNQSANTRQPEEWEVRQIEQAKRLAAEGKLVGDDDDFGF